MTIHTHIGAQRDQKFLLRGIFLIIILLIVHAFITSQAQESPLVRRGEMTFQIVEKPEYANLAPAIKQRALDNGVEMKWIVASGEITEATPNRFRQLMVEHCGARFPCDTRELGFSSIIISSGGGRLASGLELGRLIRKFDLRSVISGVRSETHGRGGCYSACAYAFLGGIERRIERVYMADSESADQSGVIAVHQWAPNGDNSIFQQLIPKQLLVDADFSVCAGFEGTIERVQCVDAQLINYISDMGVSPKFFLSSSGSSTLINVSIEDLRDWNVVTEEPMRTWRSMRWRPGAFAALAENPDPDGRFSRILLHCDSDLTTRIELSFSTAIAKRVDETVWDGWLLRVNRQTVIIQRNRIEVGGGRIWLEVPGDALFQARNSGYLELEGVPVTDLAKSRSQQLIFKAEANARQISVIQKALGSCT